MKPVRSRRLHTDLLAAHHCVCDLLRAEYPILSLYTDGRDNWMYLWCDTDSINRHRFLLFDVSRVNLTSYLEKQITLRQVITEASHLWILEEIQVQTTRRRNKNSIRRHLWEATVSDVPDYMPTDDSYFDETMAPDLNLAEDLIPKVYALPIGGTWFSRDFEYLFKRYERIYAFFYATRPRFVRTINETLHNLLRAPWTGGYSRVNLFSRLAEILPAQHALKINKLQFASPGDVRFEAIPSIGDSIRVTTILFLKNEGEIEEATKYIAKTLTEARMNKKNLSDTPDAALRLDKIQRDGLNVAVRRIGNLLQLQEEFSTLQAHSPNIVVFAKAVVSLKRQLYKLANLERMGMLEFRKSI